jgi:hypothetical protein
LAGIAVAWQQPFREYPAYEYNSWPLPDDYNVPAEWTFARLMYPMYDNSFLGSDWRFGMSAWTMDYPRADRHLAQIVRRLTRIDARSAEQPVNLDDGNDVYYWPFLYAVEVGRWNLSLDQAAKLREYLLRGGFLMVDDFHGLQQWSIFQASMRRVFPGRPIVDIPAGDPIFSSIWDNTERIQVPGENIWMEAHQTWEQPDDKEPRWRAIYDDRGRIMVAICYNMDLGDSWENADNPEYPERFSSAGMRTAINYIAYAMTH